MILAWIGALMVGLSLGILGSGGSILTVPLLIYLVGEEEKVAIAESLGIVGAIAFAGFIPYAFKKQVHWKSVILFGLPGMAGSFLGAYTSNYVSATVQLLIFAGVMLLAAVMMFRDPAPKEKPAGGPGLAWWIIALEGLSVGILTGLVGVGGGFLIVPGLVLLGGLSMHLAVGTSLAIIAMQSITGFIKYLDVLENLNLSVDVHLMLVFGLIGAVGSIIGRTVGAKISGQGLKKGFAVFLVLMGFYIIVKNI
jgi:uncharacterized membrane protein YfcA